MNFGTRLYRTRRRLGVPMQGAADAIGISKAHLWELETGRSANPKLDLLKRLADTYTVSIGYLVGEAEYDDNRQLKVLFRSLRDLDADERQFIQEVIDLRRKRAPRLQKDTPLPELGPQFQEPEQARAYLEDLRWPHGPVCPHCGAMDNARRTKSGRPGLWSCLACRKQFTVTVGTAFEGSRLALDKWLLAIHLVTDNRAVRGSELQRRLGVAYVTANLTKQRVCEAMEAAGPGFEATLRHMLDTPPLKA